MKCKNCGHKNKDGNKFCSECGSPLIVSAAVDQFAEEWDSMGEPSAKDEGKSYLSELEEGFSNGVDDWDEVQNAEYTVYEPDERKPSELKRRVDQKKQNQKSGGAKSAAAAGAGKARGADSKRSSERSESERKSSLINKILLIILLALLAVMAFGVYKAIKDGIGTGVPKKSVADIKLNPNDPDRYYVTVRADEGTTVYFEGTDESKAKLDVSSKRDVTFNVHINSLLPQSYIETDTVKAMPNVYCIDAEGNRTDVEMPEIEITVPKLSNYIEFATPDNFESDDGVVTIRGSIATSQLDAELLIDGDHVDVDEFGNFAYSVKRDKGIHTLDFIARKIAHVTLHKTFTANVTQVLSAEQIIVIPPTFHARSLNVEDSIRVYGAVPAGANITVTSNDPDFALKTEPEVDESGNFGFEVELPIPAKSYKFFITATLEDGAVFERPFSVERPPVYNEYVPTVWQGNYEEMIKPVHVTDQRGFLIKGTIEEIIYDGDYIVAKLMLESGNLIEIEYHNHYSTASKIEVGSKYTMYGYSLGTNVSPDGNLRLFIWFVQD